MLFRKIFVRIKSLWCSNKSRYKGNKKTEYAIILKAGKEETTFMKNTIKRLSLFLLAVAIIATIVVPNGNTTYAANSYVQKKITQFGLGINRNGQKNVVKDEDYVL